MAAPDIRIQIRRKGLLLDTGLLLVVVVGLVTKGRVETFKKTSSYDKQDFKRLVDLAKHPQVKQYTSPQILAELTNHADMARGALKKALFQTISTFIAKHWEVYRPKEVVFGNSAFYPLGFADASSIEVCRETGCVLITSDAALAGIAYSMGLTVMNYRHWQGYEWFQRGGSQ